VYVDHAATSPMVPEAREAWLAASTSVGNPSSLHASGRAARRIVEESRESIAADLNARPSAVVFTSGGTEADNLAIKGFYWALRDQGSAPLIVTSAVEHHAVLDPIEWLVAHESARVHWLGVDPLGCISVTELEHVISKTPHAFVSIMWANNEIGTIMPVAEIARVCRQFGVPFHTDAVQVLGQIPLDVEELGADAITIASHKIGGPFGVGALILDPQATVTPVLHGGGQEREIRSGTLDAAAVAGFAAAVRVTVARVSQNAEHLRALQTRLIEGISAVVPDAILNGPQGPEISSRLPANVHFSFPGCEGDSLLMLLDAAGVDCSTGSACTAGIPEPSHVLLALGASENLARGSLRFSLGRDSTQQDVDAIIEALPAAVDRALRAGRVSGGAQV
jgi:cysteine desulfurase